MGNVFRMRGPAGGRRPSLQEFGALVEGATRLLNSDAASRGSYYLSRGSLSLEDDVAWALSRTAEGTAFEGTIRKVSGLRFPDITAGGVYGVEVKSSRSGWATLGGSITELTRVQGVERISVIFGKLSPPVEFRSRPYEDCLSEVIVTHHPRYALDMCLSAGETIFRKMGMTYDELRGRANPIGEVVRHYRSQLRQGESLWWINEAPERDDRFDMALSMKIRLWKSLAASEQESLRMEGLAFFPEMLGPSHQKYERFALWLASRHGVVNTSLRDVFSAGGQADVHAGGRLFKSLPRVYSIIAKNACGIIESMLAADESALREAWGADISGDRLGQWISLASSAKSRVGCRNEYSAAEVLDAVFQGWTNPSC